MKAKRILALALTLVMLVSALPVTALATEGEQQKVPIPQGEQPASLKTADGEIPVEEDWNETFPYGTFAFGSYQADVGESGAKTAAGETLPESILIPVYRLGGATGAVTARITFSPAITTDARGLDYVYDYAASAKDDLLVEFENPNPAAAYQTIGLPKWQREMQPGEVGVRMLETGEPGEGRRMTLGLSEDVAAESYRWQAKKDGAWQDLRRLSGAGEAADAESGTVPLDSELCENAVLEAGWELLWDFENDDWSGVDLRCVYFVDGRAYCSDSMMGEVYEPIAKPEPMPEDLDADAEPGFSVLEADEQWGLYEFDLTFADGETVKYIRVTALDDDYSELPELALFTITGCEGGELSGTCNTLTLMVSDNDEAGPSAVGFAAETLTVDRAEKAARIPVRREGDRSYNVTVRYETADGTARAGVDYARTEGELAFAGSIDEIEIPVELIANDAGEDLSFTLRLTELQGGGERKLCTLTTREITVVLTGSSPAPEAEGAGKNLATLLSKPDGEELGSVTVSGDALLGSGKLLQGHVEMETPEALAAELVFSSDTRSHSVEGKYTFNRSMIENYDSLDFWQDTEVLLGSSVNGAKDTAQNFKKGRSDVDPDRTGNSLVWGIDNDYITEHMRFNVDNVVQTYNETEYKFMRIDSNWGGYSYFERDSSFEGVFGNYFSSFALDVEWTSIGRQYTPEGTSLSHRYLRPKIWYHIGNARKSCYLVAEGAKTSSITPTNWDIRCYTDGSGLTRKNANSYSFNPNPPAESISVGMGQDVKLYIELIHNCCWANLWAEDKQETTQAKGLMEYAPSYVDIYRFDARRRAFTSTENGIGLTIYTANDSNEPGGNGYTAIKPTSKLYSSLAPKVSLITGKSGVTASSGSDSVIPPGALYVGSQLEVKVPSNGAFVVTKEDVFLTNEDGQEVGTVKYTGEENGYLLFNVSLIWEDMTEADLSKNLYLNVIYNRIQSIEIDVAPSTVVNLNENANEQYRETFESLFVTAPTVKYVQAGSNEANDDSVYGEVVEATWNSADFSIKTGQNTPGGIFSMDVGEGTVNLQSVNFHMDHEDVILLNGKAYAGDADIVLRELDFKQNPLTFRYYNKDFLDAISPMVVTVTQIELWYDGNYDGENEETFGINGVFESDEDEGESFTPNEGDELIGVLSGEYPDSKFKPVKDENGVVHQYFLRVNYTMRPRALVTPAGATEDDKAQILPGIMSAVTDAEAAAALTEEQRSYRWVRGMDVNNKTMYGAEASAPNHVDFPLGGDAAKVYMEMIQKMVPDKEDPTKTVCQTDTSYTWDPEYVGQLLIPFQNPTPITNTDNITGSAVELAGETVDCGSDGVYAYSEEGRSRMNAYLASFTGRSGLAIAVQQQPACVAEGVEMTAGDINPDTVSLPNLRSTPSPDALNNLGGNGDVGEAGGEGPGGAMDMEEFSPDLGTELPNLEFPLGDYASIVVDGYQIGFTIGLPIFKHEDERYSSEKEHSTAMDGSRITEQNVGDTHIREIESADKKTHTRVETVPDPNDPNRRTKTVTTEKVDDKGQKTTRKEVIEEVNENGGWSGTNRKVNTDAPETPSNNQSTADKLQDNFIEANGQMKTLTDFCAAVGKGDRKQLGEFMNGQFKDDDSFQNAMNGNSKMRKVSVSFSVQLAIMFEYNPIDDGYFFKTAGISATLGFEITVQARLPACPVFYVYLKFGAEVEAAISLSVHRIAVEGEEIKSFLAGSPQQLQEGRCRSLVFELDMREEGDGALGARGFHMDLEGTVFMRVYDNKALNGSPLATGGLSGDGSQKEVLFEAYNKIVYVQLEARGDSWPEIHNLKPVLKAESKTVFDGLSITPSLSMEVGAGVGVELLKFEIFLKTNIAITMTMGGYYEESDSYEGFYISAFEWNIALGFNVTVLFINYSMDVVAFGVEGQQDGTGGYFTWDITASLANGAKELWSKTTYTTADAESLDEPVKAYGANIFKDNNSFTFYNPNGAKTNLSDTAGNNEGWVFRSNVSPNKWWGGGLYNGERPLNDDLAVASKKGAYVTFSVANPEVDLYFKGEIEVWDSVSGKTANYKNSPAKLSFGSSTDTQVRVTAKTENTKLDRVSVPKKSRTNAASVPTRSNSGEGTGLVHRSGPRDITAVQGIARPGEHDTRAIPATGTEDFQLSGYNTAGDAKLLAWGMETGYTYKMAQVGNDTYVVYYQMDQGVPKLVLSKLIMTGKLTEPGTGFVHPLNPENMTGYLLLDDDAFMDLDFDLAGSGNTLTVTWTTYGDTNNSTYQVKRRSFDLAAGTAGEINALQSSDRYLSLPAVLNGNVLWAEASGSGESANEELKAWLIAKKEGLDETMFVPDENGDYGVVNPELAGSVFFWAAQSSMNELNGSGTVLKTAGGKSAEITGQIENIETTVLDGKTYLLYTTSEVDYFDASLKTPLTVTRKDINSDTERVIIRNLWLQSLDGSGFAKARLLQTIMDADGCSESNLASAKLKDGIYAGSSLVQAKADPYFANLSFVTAQLDENGLQTMALFEMGGNTYLISEADLKAAAANSNASVTLIPVFSETTGTELSIGADEEGNLLAVYTAPVANSQSNAIYAAWWDKHLGCWGTPTILAMRNLQIYEDRITYSMTPEEAELAYIGEQDTPGGNTGSKDKLSFSNLQIAAHTYESSDGKTATRLIVLTEGSFVQLREGSFVMGEGKEPYKTLIPANKAEVRFYAIAFGAGEQAIGEGSLGFANTDFTVGSTLVGELSFTNTGTAAIRASKDNAATVELRYGMISEELHGHIRENLDSILANSSTVARWNLITPVPSGSPVRLTFTGAPLAETITEDNSFFLYVKEDAYFGDNAYAGILTDLMSVENRPDLSFGSVEISLSNVEDGFAYLNFRANVQNLGSAEAENVYIQFSFSTGEEDEFGNQKYKPINITGSELTTDLQKLIPTKKPVEEDYRNGVYHLIDQNGGHNLEPGYFRLVTGMLSVPVECFVDRENFSGLHLRAELYSNFDSPDYNDGMYSFDHNEYNGGNNGYEQIFKHETCFTMPSRIHTALGTTLRLPVTMNTTSKHPEIVVTEITDGTEGWTPRMGYCYYDAEHNAVVAAPNSTAQAMLEAGEEPTGIIQVKDLSTNSIFAVTYRVGVMAEGVNIYRDDASFTFHNADGSLSDLSASDSVSSDWIFLELPGTNGWTGGGENDIPMNNDLSQAAADGAYFTFETLADTIDFYFMGEITVTVKDGENQITELSATESPCTVRLYNEYGALREVRVTAGNGTKIDRYIPSYKTDTVVDADPASPKVLWNRSFPEPFSLKNGESVPMTCYILDEGGLKEVRFNGLSLSENTEPKLIRVDEGFWYFDYTFTENGKVTVNVEDLSSNTGSSTVYVGWFNDVTTIGAISEAPGLTREHLDFVNEAGSSVSGADELNEAPYLISKYRLAENETSSANMFTDGVFSDDLGKLGAERWLAAWNGCYLVYVNRDDGTWARAVTRLNNLNLEQSEEKPELEGDGTPGAPFLIANRDDWLVLKRWVEEGHSTAGKYFRQIADITVTEADMIGALPESASTETDAVVLQRSNGNPMGSSEAILGGKDSVTVKGWAVDPDDPEAALTIQVYIGEELHEITANKPRPDVSDIHPEAGEAHGYEETIRTELTGKQTVTVLAVNTGKGSDVLLGTTSVIIGAENCFMGVYDGGGFTLTFQADDAPANCAPFQYAKNATFRNLRIDGTIKTGNKYAAGLCANAMGVINVENCRSDITIQSRRAGECTYGGLIAEGAAGSEITITGCTVSGRLLGSYSTMNSGFVGCARGDVTIQNSVFAPAELNWRICQNFARVDSGVTLTLTNSYYVVNNSNNQGVRGYAILPGENIALDFGTGKAYNVSGVTSFGTGLIFNDVFYAGAGESVSVQPSFTGNPEDAETAFVATAGEFIDNRGAYTLVMPAEDVTINMADHVWGDYVRYEWSADGSVVTANVSCIYNPSHVRQETARMKFYLTMPSTAEREGTGFWKGTFEDPSLEEQIRLVTIPKVGCTGDETCPGSGFSDMPPYGNYAHTPIDWAVINHITTGITDDTFGTRETVTRAQFITFLWLLNGRPESELTELPFKDVKTSAYYYKALLWALEQGITSGTTPTTFSPNDACTRAQIVSFLWTAAGKPKPTVSENPFTDVKPDAYYYKPVLWAFESGVTSGTTATTFGPKDNCTRGQAMTFLYKVFGR